jgi:signal peptidase I
MDLAERVHDAAKHDLAAEVIRQFGEVRMRVNGASMLPSVWPGDVVTVRRRDTSELLPGRIVLCYRDGGFIAHRLVGQRGEELITRGDSHGFEDSPFRPDEVLGEVVSIQRRGRSVAVAQAWWHKACSWLVARSEVGTRLLLRVGRLQRLEWVN